MEKKLYILIAMWPIYMYIEPYVLTVRLYYKWAVFTSTRRNIKGYICQEQIMLFIPPFSEYLLGDIALEKKHSSDVRQHPNIRIYVQIQ
jgi:hypothetical protein